MEYKKINVTAVNLAARKSVTVIADMKSLARCKTETEVKKALHNLIQECKIFKKEDMPKLKYQGLKDVLAEWRAICSDVSEKKAAVEKKLFAEAESYHSNYNLKRFITAQEHSYSNALQEMRNGHKTGHWIWYIFPQQKGLGQSYNSQYYGLDGISEAKAYLLHPVLGKRLREICQALLDNKGKNIQYIMGSSIDVLKLKTSMQLFDLVAPNDIFGKVLQTFFLT